MCDTIGAVLGPLLGVALLAWARGLGDGDQSQPFRFVFWLTLVPGVLSVLSFAIIVRTSAACPASTAARNRATCCPCGAYHPPATISPTADTCT